MPTTGFPIDPDHPWYDHEFEPGAVDSFAKAFSREALEQECEGHPGWIEIMGVRLSLDDPADAALAAKWLDGKLAAMAANFLAHGQAERTI